MEVSLQMRGETIYRRTEKFFDVEVNCGEMEIIQNALEVYIKHLDETRATEKNIGLLEFPVGQVNGDALRREVVTETRTLVYDLRRELVELTGHDLSEEGC